ncbi:hypothetical protein ACX4MV_00645, partial [Roseomonas mucosa]
MTGSSRMTWTGQKRSGAVRCCVPPDQVIRENKDLDVITSPSACCRSGGHGLPHRRQRLVGLAGLRPAR